MLPRLSPKPSRWKYFALLSIILVFAVGIRLYLASNQARCSHDNYFSLLDEHGIPTWQMEANGLLHYYQDY